MRIKIVIVALAAMSLCANAEAYVVPNNDFELPDLAPGTQWYGHPNNWYTFVWHAGWTAGGTGGVIHESWFSNPYYCPPDPDGDQWGVIPIGRKALSDPSGTQNWAVGNCTVEADAPIVIDFNYGKKYIWTASTELLVVIDAYHTSLGWLNLDSYVLSIPWANDAPAQTGHAQVVLNTKTSIHGSQWIGTALHVGFIAQGAGSYNWAETLIDDVVITPEPATIGLMGLGAVFVLCKKRR